MSKMNTSTVSLKPKEILEIIMTQHWDMAACRCWICVNARKAKCKPREIYLQHKCAPKHKKPMVYVRKEEDADELF